MAAAAVAPPVRAAADALLPLAVVGGSVAVVSMGDVTPVVGVATDSAVQAVRPADWNAANAAGPLITLCTLADTVLAVPAVVATEKATFTAAASRWRPAGASLTAVMLTALAATERDEATAALNAAACAVPNVGAV